LFGKFVDNISKNADAWENYVLTDDESYLEKIPCGYESLPPFEKLLILKVFKPEKLMFAC